eukprot:2134430-Prorocentrum_lima.AAC.1
MLAAVKTVWSVLNGAHACVGLVGGRMFEQGKFVDVGEEGMSAHMGRARATCHGRDVVIG